MRALIIGSLLWLPVAGLAAPQAPATTGEGRPASPAAKPAAAARAKRAPADFDSLAERAATARAEQRLDEAIDLYQQAVALRPGWTEGHWYLGASAYELDRYEIARNGFRRVTQLSPENAAAWVFRGLCDFQLRNYDDALTFLLRGRTLGIGQSKQLVSVARYHTAILMSRIEQYEHSLQVLRDFALEGDDGPRIIEAMGIAVLRMPILPADLPGIRRDMVMLAGRAAYFTAARFNTAAQKALEELVARYPETPNVHYAYAVFLTSEAPDQAIEEYQKELKVSPRHPWAKMQLAYEYIRRAEWENARPWAQQAVDEAPNLFVARRALGQVLLETGDVEGAIREFEAGVKMASDSPAMRFALARAYRRAGRREDAEREQAEFTKLDRVARARQSGVQSVGGIELDSDPATRAVPQQ